jgi:trimeric autotransporter adhesin
LALDKYPIIFTALIQDPNRKTMYLTARTRVLTALFIPFIFAFSFFSPKFGFAQGDESSGATSLTSSTSCTIPTSGNPTYTLNNATASVGVPAGCITGGDGKHYDVWFSFSAANASETVTIGNFGSNITNPEVQIFSGTAYANFISKACGTTSATATSLTVGTTYYVRVSNVGTDPSGNGQTPKFDICLTHPTPPPSNDDCSGAVTLTSGSTNSSGTVWSATASSSIPVGCATGNPDDDVWYKITTGATSNSLTVSLSSIGSDLTTSGARIQVFTGSCASLTSYACGTTSLTTAVSGNTTYYIRVYSAGTGSIGSISSGSVFSITATVSGPTVITAGRMNEVFQETILSDNNVLNYPWEITYGPDNMLWITESRGYKVYRMDPSTGVKTTVLDLFTGSTWLPSPYDSLNAVGVTSTSNWNTTANKWPQGGLAGLAIHPKFPDSNYVYVSYVHRYLSGLSTGTTGMYFRNKLVRFTYNFGTGKLESPMVLCDTLPGSSDHNSQRIIIAKITADSLYYLYYAQGDMGAGQFENRDRPNKAQTTASYEGKILRFNLSPDNDGGGDAWIPNDNPYSATSAVFSMGIRNNQGFACDTAKHILYGASHGPYSDDEINIIEGNKNYGHPLIEGFASDGNVNNTTAGAPLSNNGGVSTCPMITSESNAATLIGSTYKDPLFSAYPNSVAFPSIYNLWSTTTGANANWPTEAWSGLDFYSNTLIPGWKNSLVAASLKWGRLVRLKLNSAGTATAPNNTVNDTITYLNSKNRFRDLTFSPNGKDIFVIMDNSSTTSGPGNANPVVPTCAGCVQKYTFLGYNSDVNGKSTIPTSIDVAAGTANACQTGTTITIDNTNNTLWVPITGQDGNVLAEIKANGNNLGTVTSSFYTNTGAVRENASKKLYSNRNITITPQTQPSSAVSIRIYMTTAEFNSLKTATNSQGNPSGVTTISDVSILKNSDVCGSAMVNTTTTITPQYAEAFGSNYVLQGSINSFSTFYLGNPNAIILPVQLLTFSGSLQDNSAILQWETTNEINASHFIVERSLDGNNFAGIGTVAAAGNTNNTTSYSLTDINAGLQQTAIIYYRLKIVSSNGQYSYSKVISFILKNITVSVFPNPVKQMLNIKLNGRGSNPLLIQISDLNGKVIYSEHTSGQSISIDVKQWKSQVYIVRVMNLRNEILASQKFEKM